MSEASKAAALAHAVSHHQTMDDPATVLNTARMFHDFIVSETAPKAAVPATKAAVTAAKPAATAVKPTAAKPVATAAKKPVAAKPEPEPEAEETEVETEVAEGDASKEDVAAAVEALLNADMRDAAKDLFKKYNAKSLSALGEENYAAFVNDANDLLMSA